MHSELQEMTPESKATLSVLAGGIISAGCCLLCALCGLDPTGGASPSWHSASAAALGAAAGAPLVAVKAVLWSDTAQRQLPFLEQIHRTQVGGLGQCGWVLLG